MSLRSSPDRLRFYARKRTGGWSLYFDEFPPVGLSDENGLVAVGGQYTPECFLKAYRHGIFPWPDGSFPDPLIPWFSPPSRFVLKPQDLHVSHSLRRLVGHESYTVRADTAFHRVIQLCASAPRPEGDTWISQGIIDTFCTLHRMGYAHSIECYIDGELAGGFYGMGFGLFFGGESMFTRVNNAAKIALVRFVRRCHRFRFPLIDCQAYTDNMARYGASFIPRPQFLHIMKTASRLATPPDFWSGDWGPQGETCPAK